MDQFTEALLKSKGNFGAIFESFGFKKEYVNEDNNSLVKAHIESIFGCDAKDRGFVIEKRGKEIKTKLTAMREEEVNAKTLLETRMEALLAAIDLKPTVSVEKDQYWRVDGWMEVIGSVPDKFPYEYGWENYPDDVCSSPISEQDQNIPKDPEIRKKIAEYNKAVDMYIECKKEIAMLDTMLRNFADDKVYSLNVREATLLGY